MIYVYGQDYLQFPFVYIGNDDVICNILTLPSIISS